ncbi:SIT4 phosphatase-associated protein-domain-containing protein [Entophlyctis helioformis]|nr:SIT4 phosphatase-associated protein-domain-containing protein [Entophlyctis helioformis]
MFWRFGFNTTSVIDGILDKEGVTLDDIMGEDELIQEVKTQSVKLIEFLCKPHNLDKLLGYITADDLDEAKRFKYPFVASEIFGCEVFAICEALIQNRDILIKFWTFLERSQPLNPLQASYFTKVNCVLLNKKTAATIGFLRSQPNAVQLLLKHVGCSAIADLILKLISVEDLPEGAGIIKWLSGEGLIARLFSQLDPNLDPEVHTTAAQTLMDIISVSYQSLAPPEQMNALGQPIEAPPSVQSGAGNILIDEMKSEMLLSQLVTCMLDRDAANSTSSLTNGINIIMELIRKYCSEIEHAEIQHHEYQVQLQSNRVGMVLPTAEKLNALAVDMNDLLLVITNRIVDFASFLERPKAIRGPMDTTLGKQIPLGSERLKICELFAELLHLQYLFTSSPLFESFVKPPPYVPVATDENPNPASYTAPTFTVVDGLMGFTERLVDQRIMVVCINLFFTFKWNNFLHSVVYDMIAKVFNTFSYTSSIPTPLALAGPVPSIAELPTSSEASSGSAGPTSGPSQNKMKELRASVKRLVVSIFKDANLMSQITNAQHQNDYEVEQPKGVRLGYMGHLTYIADEVCKLIEKCSPELDDQIHDYIVSEEWQEYVSHPLRETRERDRQSLGGPRPEAPQQGMAFMGAGSSFGYNNAGGGGGGKFGEDSGEFGKPRKKSEVTREGSDEEDDSPGRGVAGESETYNDQFARFLCQQLVKDLPDRFLGGDNSDDDEEADRQWMGDLDGKDVNFDIAEAIHMDNQFPNTSRAREPDEETLSDDMASSKVDGDDESILDSRNTGASESESAPHAAEFVADFDGAFSTKELERAIDGIATSSTAYGASEAGASSSSTAAPSSIPAADWADFSTLGSTPAAISPISIARKDSAPDVE